MAESDDDAMKRLMEVYADRKKDRARYNTRWRKRRSATPEPAKNVLDGLFRYDPQTLEKIEQARALQAWPQFVGDAAAQVSEPLKIRGVQLVVRVPDPMWRQQLLFLRSQILAKYRRHFPRLKLKEIYFTAY